MKTSFRFIIPILTTLLILGSCKKKNPEPEADYSTQLNEITNNVIISTYQDLDNKASALVAAIIELENAPSQINLDAAKQAWRDARLPWEQSEGFLYGPVDFEGIDPSIDSWPVNEVDLENVLSGGDALTKEYVDALEGTLKGFHTIEYLLFGTDGSKQPVDFTVREFEFLVACAQSLKGATDQLYTGWITTGDNFGKNFLHAGTTASIYPSQKAALQEAVNGLITIADEVGNGKINDPFSQQDVTLEESRFSANSKTDFADNIRSIRNIYVGSISSTEGNGLSSIVVSKNNALDMTIRTQIDEAIDAIEAIPGTFTVAIFNHQSEVSNAQTKVRDLQETLQSQLLPLITDL